MQQDIQTFKEDKRAFGEKIAFIPMRFESPGLVWPPTDGITGKDLAKVLETRNEKVDGLPQEHRDAVFYTKTPDDVLNYLKKAGNCYAFMARFAKRTISRKLNPFDALVFVQKVPGEAHLYEVLEETFVSDYDVSNIEVPFTLENYHPLGDWSVWVKYFHHVLSTLEEHELEVFAPISELMLCLTRGGTFTGNNNNSKNYQMQAMVVIQDDDNLVKLKMWSRLASNTRTTFIFNNLRESGGIQLIRWKLMEAEEIAALSHGAAEVIMKFPCRAPSSSHKKAPAFDLQSVAAPEFDWKTLLVPNSQWNLFYNLVYHYTHCPASDEEGDEDQEVDHEMDHEAYKKAETKDAIKKGKGLHLDLTENMFMAYARASGTKISEAILYQHLYDQITAQNERQSLLELTGSSTAGKFTADLSGLALHCGVGGDLSRMEMMVRNMAEKSAQMGATLYVTERNKRAVICAMLAIDTPWQVWKAVDNILRNYSPVIEKNLLDRWHIVQMKQREELKAFFIPKLLGLLLVFLIEHLALGTSFKVTDAELKGTVACKDDRPPDLSHAAILASTVTITEGHVDKFAKYISADLARTARISSTSYALKIDGRSTFARPVGALREIHLETQDGAEELPPHDPLPGYQPMDVREGEVVLDTIRVKATPAQTLTVKEIVKRFVMNVGMMVDMGWKVFPQAQPSLASGRYVDPVGWKLKPFKDVVDDVLKNLRDNLDNLGGHYGPVTAEALVETRADIIYSVIFGAFPSLGGEVIPGVHYFPYSDFACVAEDKTKETDLYNLKCNKVKLFLRSVGATKEAEDRWAQFSDTQSTRLERGVMYFATKVHVMAHTPSGASAVVDKIVLIEPLVIKEDAEKRPILVTNPLYYHIAPAERLFPFLLRGHGSLEYEAGREALRLDPTLNPVATAAAASGKKRPASAAGPDGGNKRPAPAAAAAPAADPASAGKGKGAAPAAAPASAGKGKGAAQAAAPASAGKGKGAAPAAAPASAGKGKGAAPAAAPAAAGKGKTKK